MKKDYLSSRICKGSSGKSRKSKMFPILMSYWTIMKMRCSSSCLRLRKRRWGRRKWPSSCWRKRAMMRRQRLSGLTQLSMQRRRICLVGSTKVLPKLRVSMVTISIALKRWTMRAVAPIGHHRLLGLEAHLMSRLTRRVGRSRETSTSMMLRSLWLRIIQMQRKSMSNKSLVQTATRGTSACSTSKPWMSCIRRWTRWYQRSQKAKMQIWRCQLIALLFKFLQAQERNQLARLRLLACWTQSSET